MAMAAILVCPFVDVLIVVGGWRWIAAYAVVARARRRGRGASPSALTIALFALIGAKRTRFAAQVLAAIVGAAFAVGVQIVSIYSYGSLSRVAAFHSQTILAHRAGDRQPRSGCRPRAPWATSTPWPCVLVASALLLGVVTVLAAGRFARYATAAAGLAQAEVRQTPRRRVFASASAAAVLRRKEWTLIAARPLARLADADAALLSPAAGPAAVAQLPRRRPAA